MSLATSMGGGGAGAGMSMAAMAHGGPSALSTHQQTASAAGGPPLGGSSAPPANMSALAADLIDKNQNLGMKMIKNLAKMPIVSVDLYGDTGEVSYFPPVNVSEGETISGKVAVKSVGKVLGSGSSLVIKKDSDVAHRALRKLITKSKGYEAVFSDALISNGKGEKDGIVIQSPHLLLGERQVKYIHPASSSKYTLGKENTHVIEEDEVNQGVTINNGNLDGSSGPQDNDFDRVTLHLKIHSSKKALSILPEEAVAIVLAKAKSIVSKKCPVIMDDDDNKDDDNSGEESYLSFPPAIAVPAWACNHYAIDALMDACQGSAVLYNRSVAALAGALVPKPVKKDGQQKMQTTNLWNAIMDRYKANEEKMAELQKQKKPLPKGQFMPIVVMAGMTEDGLELTAVQIKDPQSNYGAGDLHCPFLEYKVVSSVSYQHSKPVSLVSKAVVELSDVVDEVYPELEDDGGVTAIVTYGTIATQLQLKDAVNKALNSIEGDDVWNTKINFLSTQEEAVAIGTSVLAGVSHGRTKPEFDNEGRRQPTVTVQNVAPSAVGVAYNFFGGKKGSSWTEPKIIFDYDRRVPAGPYKLEFTAAECVSLRNDEKLLTDMEKLVEESQQWAKGKHNAKREEAALDLRIKVVSRFERDGKWRDYGYSASPLAQGQDLDEDDKETETDKIAIEASTLELSLDAVGYLDCSLTTDGKTIDQAIKAARSSTFWYYFRILAAMAFFGGFMAKSYIDERSRAQCAQRILAFYKRATPGSISDGDEHNAHYVCYKYKGKRNKLYKKLEKKYGIEVKEVHEWEDEEEEEKKEGEEEVDLDDEKGQEF